jgi:hypothetical protein
MSPADGSTDLDSLTDEDASMGMPARGVTWSRDAELIVEFHEHAGPDHPYRVEGLDGFEAASARIAPRGSHAELAPSIRLRPLSDPAGPFDLSGILYLTPFLEQPGAREPLIAFEERIGRRYYEFMAAVRWRYAAACDVEVAGLPIEATCAEVYSIDAASRAEAEALDALTSPEPPDVAEFYRECAALKVRGSTRRIWLIPG